MALTIATEIAGQEFTPLTSYCYLYEPLRIQVTESDATAKKLYVELEILDTGDTNTIVENLTQYAVFDLNPGQPFSFDIMKLAQQHHNTNIYKVNNLEDLLGGASNLTSMAWTRVVSEYVYKFKITTDITTEPIYGQKLPIIGQRGFNQFEPFVWVNQCLNPFARGNSGTNGYFTAVNNGPGEYGRWNGRRYINNTLSPLTYGGGTEPLTDLRPNIYTSTNLEGRHNCAGMVVWKSRFGGWQVWGFDSKKESNSSAYKGNLKVGLFESTAAAGGSPYVPVDYSSIESSYSISLKALSLSSEELLVCSDIKNSPAVYFMRDESEDLELMRLTSATVPLDSKASGGNFSITLKSISKSYQHTR